MNTAPLFDSNGRAKVQLGAVNLNKIVIGGQRTQLLPSHGARVSTTPGGTAISIPKRRTATPVLPPFYLTLYPGGTDDAPTYQVAVNRGYVVERVPTDDDGLQYYLPDELEETDGTPKKHDISAGQAVYVTVEILATGGVDTVTLGIESDGATSTHYVPKVADIEGTPGTYKFKLGVLDADTNKFKNFCAGSNIEIDRDLPSFEKKGGDHDIFVDYSLLNGKYRTRGISEMDSASYGAEKPIEVNDAGDFLQFRTRGKSMNITIGIVTPNIDGVLTYAGTDYTVLYFRDGLFKGTTDPGGSADYTFEVLKYVAAT